MDRFKFEEKNDNAIEYSFPSLTFILIGGSVLEHPHNLVLLLFGHLSKKWREKNLLKAKFLKGSVLIFSTHRLCDVRRDLVEELVLLVGGGHVIELILQKQRKTKIQVTSKRHWRVSLPHPQLPPRAADEDEVDLVLLGGVPQLLLRGELRHGRAQQAAGEGHDVVPRPVALVRVDVVSF